MSDTIESNITDIRMAYRLMLHSRITEARQSGDKTAEKAATSELEKDDVQISEAGKSAQTSNVTAAGVLPDMNVDIRLADLFKKIYGPKEQPQKSAQAQVIEFFQKIETEATLTYFDLEKVEGLVVRNQNLAETDRYRFEFVNGSTLKITDKWSSKSTTIWGDPHVDTSDQEGDNNGDFKDLSGSDKYTTFMLSDNTRITFTARDNGIIEQVDIFNGNQHLAGIGAGSSSWDEKNGLFAQSVTNDAFSALSSVPVGDVVYAGGDGNDWFDAERNLIWGKTTDPSVISRPSGYIEFTYNQRISQQISILQVDQQV
ncbi:MAG: hypothetical protein C0410_15030 [Anaerolinea sp.]|nr:hypothetical protein [Anaerolinea sp.]